MSEKPKRPWFLRRWAWAMTGGVNQNLLSAAAQGQSGKAMGLLESGADIEFRDHSGWTALMFAAGGNHASTVSVLLARGANPNTRLSDGRTALKIASDLNRVSVVAILKAAGAAE